MVVPALVVLGVGMAAAAAFLLASGGRDAPARSAARVAPAQEGNKTEGGDATARPETPPGAGSAPRASVERPPDAADASRGEPDVPAEGAAAAVEEAPGLDESPPADEPLPDDEERPALAPPRGGTLAFPADSGMIDVTKPPYGAKGDGRTDDTAAIQRALSAGLHKHMIVCLPAGTYLVSDTLKWHDPANEWNGGWGRFLSMQGQGEGSTVIRLRDRAAGFTDAASPRPVVMTASGDDRHNYSDANGEGNQAFENSIRDLTIDVGSGNAGAVGVDYQVSNWGAMRHVTVMSSDPAGAGHCGIAMARRDNGPGMLKDVRVVGFRLGVFAAQEICQMVLENLALEGQTECGILLREAIFSVRRLASRNAVPAVRVERQALLVLLDSRLEGGSPDASAVVLADGDSRALIRNVRATGYASAIASRGAPVDGLEVAEWVSDPAASAFPSRRRGLALEVRETPERVERDLAKWVGVRRREDWAGLDLGRPQTIARVRFCPRRGFEARMAGGRFQGANRSDFSDAVDLHVVAGTPPFGPVDVAVEAPGEVRYARYVGPPGSHANIAEMDLFDASGRELDGAVIGTEGSWENRGDAREKVFDGDVETHFDAPDADDTAAVRAAMGCGRPVVYFPAGDYRLGETVEVPPHVRLVVGMGTTLGPSRKGAFGERPMFRVSGGSARDVTVFDRLAVYMDDELFLEHASPRTVVVRDTCGTNGYRASRGAGRLFLEDVCGGGQPRFGEGQSVWARQFDIENAGNPKVMVDNAKLWCLGFKSETHETLMEVRRGGALEVLGGFAYTFGVPRDSAAFVSKDSRMSLTFAGTSYVNGFYHTIVRETRGRETHTFTRDGAIGRGMAATVPLFVGAE